MNMYIYGKYDKRIDQLLMYKLRASSDENAQRMSPSGYAFVCKVAPSRMSDLKAGDKFRINKRGFDNVFTMLQNPSKDVQIAKFKFVYTANNTIYGSDEDLEIEVV